jgi:surface polysaccharide O-acyltransferase-like enzyme
MVVFLHTTLSVVGHFTEVPTSHWWQIAVLDIWFLPAVPLFVMISGALLLSPKDEPMGEFYRKRFIRVVPPALFYFFIYGWWSVTSSYDTDVKSVLIKTFVYGQPYKHLYFVFVILGLYAITPYLRKFIKTLSKKEFGWLLILLFGLTAYWDVSTTWVTRSFPSTHLFAPSLWVPYLGYYLAGFYIHQHVRLHTKQWGLYLFIGTTLVIVLAEYLLAKTFGQSPRGLMARNYHGPLIILQSVSLFSWFTTLTNLKVRSWIRGLAGSAFGVYLVHQILLDLVISFFALSPLSLTAPIIMLIGGGILVVSFVLTFLLSKVPFFGRLSGVE